jgi:penicillin amidase
MSLLNNLFTSVLRGGFKTFSRSSLPQTSGSLNFAGLLQPVEILRDRWGIPHIYAQNSQDLAFSQGFVHAQDRLWQMELNRRTARGQLSEVFGEMALDTDRASRTFGFDRLGQADFPNLPDETRGMIEAYTAGVNAFLNDPHSKLPVEFNLLRHKPAPWQVEDSMAFSRLMYWQLSHAWYSEIVRAQLHAAVGQEHAGEWEVRYPPQNPSILPAGVEFNRLTASGGLLGGSGPFLDRGKGSNCWAISGQRSETGRPYLCNDMHLVLTVPTIWYEVHLMGGPFNVTGVSIPGLPFVLTGHNEKIAWGITLAFTDCEDLFVEKFDAQNSLRYQFKEEWLEAKVVPEPIRVKGRAEPFVENVLYTRHGPVISDVVGYPEQRVAVQSNALQATQGLYGWWQLNQAKGWDDFVEAMRQVNATQLNIGYADVEGNIGYWVTGATPVRAKGDGTLPAPGWTGEYEWTGEVPFEEMPHALNPEQGFVVTANNRIIPEEYPWFFGNVWMNGYRAKRLTELLTSKEKLGPADFNKMQLDVLCQPGREFAALVKDWQAPDALGQEMVKLLAAWDGQLTAQSAAGAVYEVLRYQMVRALLEPQLGKEMTTHLMGVSFNPILLTDHEFFGYDTVNLLLMLDNPDSWWMQQAGGREALLKRCFAEAGAYLSQQMGADTAAWQWGKLHSITFAHALGAQKPLDKVFNRGPYPLGGDTDTPLQAALMPGDPYENKMWSPSVRFIFDLSDLSRSQAVTPVGQSGHVASAHYDDMIPLYLNGEYHPLLWTRQQVEADLEAKLVLNPAAKEQSKA